MKLMKKMGKALSLALFFILLMLLVTLTFKKIPFIVVLGLLITTVILMRQDMLFHNLEKTDSPPS